MSVDRFLAIKYPALLRKLNAVYYTKICIFMTWGLSLLLLIPTAMVSQIQVLDVVPSETVEFCGQFWSSQTNRHVYDVCLLCVVYLVPGAAIVTVYVIMGRELWTPDSRLPQVQIDSVSESGINRRQSEYSAIGNPTRTSGRRRVARMWVLVAVVFNVCWMPYYIFSTVTNWENGGPPALYVSMSGLHFSLWLGHVNCAISPVLYCFLGRTFRRKMMKYVRLKCSSFSQAQVRLV